MAMRRGRGGLSLAQQALSLRARHPDGSVRLHRDRLTWRGTLQPTPLSRSYRIEVAQRPGQVPTVRVLDELATRPGESLPHVYADGTLCLHLPGEWTLNMSISESTVVWAAEWLQNYEIWLATGRWHGGGQWPPGVVAR